MITRDLRAAITAAVAAETGGGPDTDPGLRPGAAPGQYASSVAFGVARYTRRPPATIARAVARRISEHDWVADAAATGAGYVTVTVTPEALSAVADRITEAGPDACVRNSVLAGREVPAPPSPGAWATARTWDEARDLLHAELAAVLAEASGARIQRIQRIQATGRSPGGTATTGRSDENDSEVGSGVAFAGADAVKIFLARVLPGQHLEADPRIIARQVPGNPAYAVRYAHARAASGVRWAAAIATADACPQRPPSYPGELKLLDVLSWLPERVATAARRGRPDEFVRYLGQLADVTLDALTSSPGTGPAGTSPMGGTAPGSDRLALAKAARTGLAAGLTLLGVSAPDRLLPGQPSQYKHLGDDRTAMSRVAHPAGPRYADVLPADHPPAPPADLNELDPGIWPRNATRDPATGALTIGGIDVRDLAGEYGTPVFVMDEEDVRERCRDYVNAFGAGARVCYAAKAFCSRAVLRWVSEEGLGVDVCSGGELEVALSAGVYPAGITLHGNNKLPSEIRRAVEQGVGHIVIDSFEEIARVAYHADQAGTRANVLVRVTTGVEAHTHEFMATAHDDQKFGFSMTSGAADEAVRRVLSMPGLEFRGLHSHIGSQIFDTAGFEVAAHRVIGLAARVHAEHGVAIEELDLGGGFGIAYTEEDDPPDVKSLAQSLRSIVSSQCAAAGLPEPQLTIEPGRGIVGPSTVTLYEVGTIKDVDGLRTYVSVDGGMSDNVRTALYDATYTCTLASRRSKAKPMLSRVVGRHCESGDIVVRHAYLPDDLAPGDLLAVAATGAYCWSLASNYNHLARPGVVAVRDGASREIVRRETLADLLALDVG